MKNTSIVRAIVMLAVTVLSFCGCDKDKQKNPLVGTWVKCHNVMGDISYYDENGEPLVHLCDPSFLKERMKNDRDWDVITFTKKGIMYNNRRDLYDNKTYTILGDSVILVDGKYHLDIKLFDKKGMLVYCWGVFDEPGEMVMFYDVVFTKIK